MATKAKPKTTPKAIVLLIIASLLFAIVVVEITTRLIPGLTPPGVRAYFGGAEPENWGLMGDPYLGFKYPPDLVDFPAPVVDDKGGTSSYPVSTVSLGYKKIGFRDDGIQNEPFAIVVGDSFTSCFGVRMEQCWVEQLENSIARDFVNLGVTAYGPQQTKRMLTKYGLPLQPKLVLWVFYTNDPDDAWRFDKFGMLDARANNKGESPLNSWFMKNSNMYLLSSFFWYNRHFLYNVINEEEREFSGPNLVWWETATDLDNPDIAEGVQLTQTTILEAKQQTEKNGAQFIVLIMPTREQVYYENPNFQAHLNAFNETFIRFFREHDIITFDLTPGIREQITAEPFLYFKEDIHFNIRGNEIVAELVQEILSENLK